MRTYRGGSGDKLFSGYPHTHTLTSSHPLGGPSFTRAELKGCTPARPPASTYGEPSQPSQPSAYIVRVFIGAKNECECLYGLRVCQERPRTFRRVAQLSAPDMRKYTLHRWHIFQCVCVRALGGGDFYALVPHGNPLGSVVKMGGGGASKAFMVGRVDIMRSMR